MHLGRMDRPIEETHRRHAFPFPPPSSAIPSAQPPPLPDRPPSGDRLDVSHRTDDLEVHRPTLARRLNLPDKHPFPPNGGIGVISSATAPEKLLCELSHSTPFAANNAFAAELAKKAMNALAVWGDATPRIGAAA